MKKTLLILSFFTGIGFANSQNVNIPDANFKAYLVGDITINTNTDSEIQVSEANSFTGEINCANLNINSMTGIEAFTNLTSLRCQGNNLTSLDISANNELQLLHCYVNSISSLNLGTNTNLYFIDCGNNQLSSLDISSNTNLYSLNCSYNQLSTLDITTSATFSELYCRNNQLTSLFLANGNNTNWTTFTAINNPNLSCIEVDDAAYSTTNWTNIDATASFSENCGGSLGLNQLNTPNVNIFPNSASNYVTIEANESIEAIAIFDLNGALVQTELNTAFSIKNLNQGVYIVHVKTANGVFTKRLIKK